MKPFIHCPTLTPHYFPIAVTGNFKKTAFWNLIKAGNPFQFRILYCFKRRIDQ
jgi:hypothetical protein